MPRESRLLCLLLILLLSACAELVDQGRPEVLQHTLKELRDQFVVKQKLDYSCGAAALATLMRFYYGDDVSEKDILDLLHAGLTEEERSHRLTHGFSLLDLKRVSQEKGYRAAGFKLSLWQASQLAAPVIVFVEPRGYKHFAVLRGIDRARAFLADPSRGNLRMSLERFLDEWSGIVFVLGKPGEEEIQDHPLRLPRPDFVQPELVRFNAQLDLGTAVHNLPLR